MTVSYADEVATAKGLSLLKLLFLKWRGSVLKLLWKDLLVFMIIYYSLQLLYRLGLNEHQQEIFENIVGMLRSHISNISHALTRFFVSNKFFSSIHGNLLFCTFL